MKDSKEYSQVSLPYFGFVIAIIVSLFILFVRSLIFDYYLYDKFNEESKNDNKDYVVLSLRNKISIKLISLLVVAVIMFIIKKLY